MEEPISHIFHEDKIVYLTPDSTERKFVRRFLNLIFLPLGFGL